MKIKRVGTQASTKGPADWFMATFISMFIELRKLRRIHWFDNGKHASRGRAIPKLCEHEALGLRFEFGLGRMLLGVCLLNIFVRATPR
jgi:hypothetical protein